MEEGERRRPDVGELCTSNDVSSHLTSLEHGRVQRRTFAGSIPCAAETVHEPKDWIRAGRHGSRADASELDPNPSSLELAPFCPQPHQPRPSSDLRSNAVLASYKSWSGLRQLASCIAACLVGDLRPNPTRIPHVGGEKPTSAHTSPQRAFG